MAESKLWERLCDSDTELINSSQNLRKLLAFDLCLSILSHLIKCPLNWTAAGQMLCARVCLSVWNVICRADERWHDARMTASHKSMLAWIQLCVCVSVEWDRDGKKMSQWQDVNHKQGGGMSYESQLRPSIFPHFSHHFFSSCPFSCHSTCVLRWGGVGRCKWGVAGWSWPFFISLSPCLSVLYIYCCLSFWWLNPCGGWVCSRH